MKIPQVGISRKSPKQLIGIPKLVYELLSSTLVKDIYSKSIKMIKQIIRLPEECPLQRTIIVRYNGPTRVLHERQNKHTPLQRTNQSVVTDIHQTL